MADPEIQSRFDLLKDVAPKAGNMALHFWENRQDLVIEAKGGMQDVVSEADRAIERFICEMVAAEFPDDGFLGEEYGFQPGRSPFYWVIDPIDGTAPFLHGLPSWCVAIALMEGQTCVAAATHAPLQSETFIALRGAGATCNDRPLRIPEGLTLKNGISAIGASNASDPKRVGAAVTTLLEQGGMFYRNGSGALMLAYVAAGRLAGYFETIMYPWDCLGGLLLVEEAGGRCRPLQNDPTEATREPILATAPAAWDDFERLFPV
ncbi:MAG: inositol monophosphatase family protein [Pseudomonadota bacterium]